MQVPDQPLIITRDEAAIRHVEAAIEALLRGFFDIAITLAGAAEDTIDRPGSLFSYHRDHPKAKELGIEEGELSNHLNEKRNWLKHNREPIALEFTRYDAAFMIARAVTKLDPKSCTFPITVFVHWWTQFVTSGG